MEAELPKLTDKENKCLMTWLTNGRKNTAAYRAAYDCSRMSMASIYVEASRFFKNPKITLWIQHLEQNQQKAVQEELNYSAKDFFEECNELKLMALECRDRYGNPNINAALKADENKAKVAGLLKDQIIHSGNVTQMPSVVVNGKELELNIGEAVNEEVNEGEENEQQ